MCISLPHVQYGETPFLTAAAMGHVEVAGFLLDNGSSILERADVSDHQLHHGITSYVYVNELRHAVCYGNH